MQKILNKKYVMLLLIFKDHLNNLLKIRVDQLSIVYLMEIRLL